MSVYFARPVGVEDLLPRRLCDVFQVVHELPAGSPFLAPFIEGASASSRAPFVAAFVCLLSAFARVFAGPSRVPRRTLGPSPICIAAALAQDAP
jgi:hypothetical protein